MNLYSRSTHLSNLQGSIVAGGRGVGSQPEQLDVPSAIDVDFAGNVFVADHGNSRIQLWPKGGHAGITIAGANTALCPLEFHKQNHRID